MRLVPLARDGKGRNGGEAVSDDGAVPVFKQGDLSGWVLSGLGRAVRDHQLTAERRARRAGPTKSPRRLTFRAKRGALIDNTAAALASCDHA